MEEKLKHPTRKEEHYYSEQQSSPLRLNEIKAHLRGNTFSLWGGSGIFSSEKVDKGTELLIENCIIQEGWNILDLGCGNGVIGIAIQKACPACKITYTDTNERALMITEKNLRRLHIGGTVKKSNAYESLQSETFNTILCNIPQKAGKETCIKIIKEAKEHLSSNGFLQIVALHNKGGRTLMKVMEETFGNITTLAKRAGYHVYCSKRV